VLLLDHCSADQLIAVYCWNKSNGSAVLSELSNVAGCFLSSRVPDQHKHSPQISLRSYLNHFFVSEVICFINNLLLI